jgi:hypothetical protein
MRYYNVLSWTTRKIPGSTLIPLEIRLCRVRICFEARWTKIGNVLDIEEEWMGANKQIEGPRKRSDVLEAFQVRRICDLGTCWGRQTR